MIRILHVVTNMNRGGLETMIMNYYRQIDRNIIQFDFLTHRVEDGAYDAEILELGGRVYHLPYLNPLSKKYKRELNAFLSKHTDYSIIHVHLNCLSSVVLREAYKVGIPVRIAHAHTNHQKINLKLIFKLYYRSLIPKYATDLMACSKAAGTWMFKGKRFSVLQNAIDSKKYCINSELRNRIRQELDINNDTIVIGHVGRFSPPKNHIFIIEVFKELHRTNENSLLLLVGDGSLKDEIVHATIESNLEKDIKFLGVRSDVEDVLQAMDVFFFPSLWEGLGIVGIEAQAAGLPCVFANTIPQECIVTHSVTVLSLSDSKTIWVDALLNSAKMGKKETTGIIIKSGFDIRDNSVRLQRFYTEKNNITIKQ